MYNFTTSNNILKFNIMTTKQKKELADKKLIDRAIDMYFFIYGEYPSANWCTSADRAKFLISYYKEHYNIIG